MRISRDDEALLERWLCSLLERLEERNPESLAKYVISLLKQDMEPMDKLQKYCEDELKTFLKEKTAPLAKKLFAALQGERCCSLACFSLTSLIRWVLSHHTTPREVSRP